MLLEIGFAQKTAIGLHEPVDLVRDFSFVKNVPAFFTNELQSFGEVWIFENITLCWCAALAVERVGFQKCARQTFIQARPKRPVIRNQFRDRKTLFGISNRRRKV